MKHQRSFLFLLGLLVWAGCSKEEGCTYVEACNYSEDAVVDDGSCDFNSCAGCTDPAAMNYDPSATVDDGSCEFDPTATTADCVSDVEFDNYTYPVVAIGGQCWFAENLRSTVFQDGTLIPEETAADFPNLVTPAQTTYNNSTSTFNAQGQKQSQRQGQAWTQEAGDVAKVHGKGRFEGIRKIRHLLRVRWLAPCSSDAKGVQRLLALGAFTLS